MKKREWFQVSLRLCPTLLAFGKALAGLRLHESKQAILAGGLDGPGGFTGLLLLRCATCKLPLLSQIGITLVEFLFMVATSLVQGGLLPSPAVAAVHLAWDLLPPLLASLAIAQCSQQHDKPGSGSCNDAPACWCSTTIPLKEGGSHRRDIPTATAMAVEQSGSQQLNPDLNKAAASTSLLSNLVAPGRSEEGNSEHFSRGHSWQSVCDGFLLTSATSRIHNAHNIHKPSQGYLISAMEQVLSRSTIASSDTLSSCQLLCCSTTITASTGGSSALQECFGHCSSSMGLSSMGCSSIGSTFPTSLDPLSCNEVLNEVGLDGCPTASDVRQAPCGASIEATCRSPLPTALDVACAIVALGGSNATPHYAPEARHLRINLKIPNRNPTDLPCDWQDHMRSKLADYGLDLCSSYVRAGCIELVLELLQESGVVAAAGGDMQAAAALLQLVPPEQLVAVLGPELTLDREVLVQQLAQAVVVLNGSVLRDVGSLPTPDLTAVSPMCLLSETCGTHVLYAAGTNLTPDTTCRVRFKSRFLDCQAVVYDDDVCFSSAAATHVISPPSRSTSRLPATLADGGQELMCVAVDVPKGACGVMLVECCSSPAHTGDNTASSQPPLLGRCVPVLVVPDPAIEEELRSLEALRGPGPSGQSGTGAPSSWLDQITLEHFVTDFGRWKEFCMEVGRQQAQTAGLQQALGALLQAPGAAATAGGMIEAGREGLAKALTASHASAMVQRSQGAEAAGAATAGGKAAAAANQRHQQLTGRASTSTDRSSFDIDSAATMLGQAPLRTTSSMGHGQRTMYDSSSSGVGSPHCVDEQANALYSDPMHRVKLLRTGLRLLVFACDRGWPVTASDIVGGLVRHCGLTLEQIDAQVVQLQGLSLLHLAVRSHSCALVQKLLQWSKEYNHQWNFACEGPVGLTPLHLAAVLNDHGAVASMLLLQMDSARQHKWFSAQAQDGSTPADLAAASGMVLLNQLAGSSTSAVLPAPVGVGASQQDLSDPVAHSSSLLQDDAQVMLLQDDAQVMLMQQLSNLQDGLEEDNAVPSASSFDQEQQKSALLPEAAISSQTMSQQPVHVNPVLASSSTKETSAADTAWLLATVLLVPLVLHQLITAVTRPQLWSLRAIASTAMILLLRISPILASLFCDPSQFYVLPFLQPYIVIPAGWTSEKAAATVSSLCGSVYLAWMVAMGIFYRAAKLSFALTEWILPVVLHWVLAGGSTVMTQQGTPCLHLARIRAKQNWLLEYVGLAMFEAVVEVSYVVVSAAYEGAFRHVCFMLLFHMAAVCSVATVRG